MRPAPSGTRKPITRAQITAFVMLVGNGVGLMIHVIAVDMARRHDDIAYLPAQITVTAGLALAYVSSVWALLQPRITRAVRNIAVVSLGVTPALAWRLRNPYVLIQYDEQQHLRTLRDILLSHELFRSNPLLAVSPRYPILEAATGFLVQIGLPTMAAVTAVIVISRVVLMLVMCDAVEHLTGSARAGGLATAVYAVNSHFVAWDTQYAYVTLALPLGISAVALVARARDADDPRRLLGGATLCLIALAMTHHATSVVTAVFLVTWSIVERGRPGSRVRYGALAAVAATGFWVAKNWRPLRDYFAPQLQSRIETITNRTLRAPFSSADPGKHAQPVLVWERVVILYWAAVVTVVVVVLAVVWLKARREIRRNPSAAERPWRPRTFLMLFVLIIPVLFVLRAVPGFGEVHDRSSTFIYFPLGLLAADGAVRWARTRPYRRVVLARRLVPAIAAGVFAGGFLLGSGPDWVRLQGGYQPSGEGRSMDSENLAAARWADRALADGSRIGADRVSALLLSSEAGLWPLFIDGAYQVPPLYFSPWWSSHESQTARGLRIRYLYVDRRLADDYPLVGDYFARGERACDGAQRSCVVVGRLTLPQLTKFEDIPGFVERYRHGPISIYDVSAVTGLPAEETRSWGWIGGPKPTEPKYEIGGGLLVGVLIALAAPNRTGVMVPLIREIRRYRRDAGLWLTVGAGIGALCFISVVLLYAGVWLTPLFFASAAIMALLANPGLFDARKLAAVVNLRPAGVLAAVTVLGLFAAAIALAMVSAHPVVYDRVEDILDQPTALHVPEPGA